MINYVEKPIPYSFEGWQHLKPGTSMHLTQFNFPYKWDRNKDKLLTNWSDRLKAEKPNGCNDFNETLKRHTGQGEMNLETFLRTAYASETLELLKALLKADPKINWTGYRILMAIDQASYPVFTFQLFARGRYSITQIFTGDIAPNISGY